MRKIKSNVKFKYNVIKLFGMYFVRVTLLENSEFMINYRLGDKVATAGELADALVMLNKTYKKLLHAS